MKAALVLVAFLSGAVLLVGCGNSAALPTTSISSRPTGTDATGAPESASSTMLVAPTETKAPTDSVIATGSATPTNTSSADLVVTGRIVTMTDPPVAEALLIRDGLVAAVGDRAEVLALAGDGARVIDIGDGVAYPGFIDAHAHWIGDREYYDIETPAEAMNAAVVRGWTSISEQWVNDERLRELESLAADHALPLRVDAYLALNGLDVGNYYGDWYSDREPGRVDEFLTVQGLKIHLDSGTGAKLYWDAATLNETIAQANEAGWQVSVHTVSTEAEELVLDAFESAIGPSGPNPLHHRIEHALQMTDDRLARIVAMDLTTVVQLDGTAYDWVKWTASLPDGEGRDYLTEDATWLGRWRDLINSGVHVAGSSDAPWFFPDMVMTDDVGRPVDEIAGGMDSRGRNYPGTADWMADQLLTAEQGLRAVTTDAAWALGEARRGHLAVGTLGDVTILSGDVLDATPDEIRAFDVVATIVGGNIVYCSNTEVC